jgi:16S rRNA (guanine527-N7)-methyltransferase
MGDSRRLRVEWLQSATETLRLTNAYPMQSRVELLPDATFDTISARAFAPLVTLVEISARFSTPDTLWLLPKGAKAAQELAMLGERWKHMFHVEQSITDPAAGIITGRLLETPSAKAILSARKGQPR